jgi:hypothetical protein
MAVARHESLRAATDGPVLAAPALIVAAGRATLLNRTARPG